MIVFLLSLIPLALQAQQQGSVSNTEDAEGRNMQRIANMQSSHVLEEGAIELSVAHRFGSFQDDVSDYFKWNNSSSNIQVIYGIWDGCQISLGGETFRNTLVGSAKIALIKQSENFPVDMTLYGTMNVNNELERSRYPNMKYPDRLSYTTQLLISRQFTSYFSMTLAPAYVRQNLVFEHQQQHDQYALGLGSQLFLTKNISFNWDYIWHTNRYTQSVYRDAFSAGMDWWSGPYVLQLILSNGQAINEPALMSNAEGDWYTGDIYAGLGFSAIF